MTHLNIIMKGGVVQRCIDALLTCGHWAHSSTKYNMQMPNKQQLQMPTFSRTRRHQLGGTGRLPCFFWFYVVVFVWHEQEPVTVPYDYTKQCSWFHCHSGNYWVSSSLLHSPWQLHKAVGLQARFAQTHLHRFVVHPALQPQDTNSGQQSAVIHTGCHTLSTHCVSLFLFRVLL